ncbi:MAG: DUF2393 family protein [Helicobacteraceae bacterium]|nr:DUF2393 family protein [Helicobacteraceae bacterium]
MIAINIWHILIILLILLISGGGIYLAFKQQNKKLIYPMTFSIILVSFLIASFLLLAVDKYTKKVSLYKLENKRLLNLEKVVYTGFVKNEGSYPIAEVTFEVKLVNQGYATGSIASTSFFTPSGFKEFFSGGGANILYNKPQIIKKQFVVARDLKPGQAEQFRVVFDFPPYFRNVKQYTDVFGH